MMRTLFFSKKNPLLFQSNDFVLCARSYHFGCRLFRCDFSIGQYVRGLCHFVDTGQFIFFLSFVLQHTHTHTRIHGALEAFHIDSATLKWILRYFGHSVRRCLPGTVRLLLFRF